MKSYHFNNVDGSRVYNSKGSHRKTTIWFDSYVEFKKQKMKKKKETKTQTLNYREYTDGY